MNRRPKSLMRHCEERSDEAIQCAWNHASGWLRCAFREPPGSDCVRPARAAAVEGAALRRRFAVAVNQERPRLRASLLSAASTQHDRSWPGRSVELTLVAR
jgi:hypothetical protein